MSLCGVCVCVWGCGWVDDEEWMRQKVKNLNMKNNGVYIM